MNLFGIEISREATGKPSGAAQKRSGGTNWLENIIAAGGEKNSMNVAAVWRCVNLISDSIAIMPLRYKCRDGIDQPFKTYIKNDRDRLYWLLNVAPNERMSGFVLKKNLVQQMLLRGNAFIAPVDERGRCVNIMYQPGALRRLVLLTSAPSYNKMRNTYTLQDMEQGVPSQTVDASCLWHFRNPGTDGGFWGESTVMHAAKSLNMLATADQLALKTVSTGGRIKAILSGIGGNAAIGQASKKQMDNAALDVEDNLSGHDIITLPDKNLELKPLSMSAAEMDFVNNRKFGVEDVCRWFGVPPYKLGVNTSNYKSVDAAQVDFYTEALLPICAQIENVMLSKTTTADDFWKTKFDFDEKPLFQLDVDARIKQDKSDLELGIKSINDLRRDRDLDPVPDGDTILMSANLKSLQALKEGNGSPTPGIGSNQ